MHLKLEFKSKDMSFRTDMKICSEEFRLDIKNYQGMKNADIYTGDYIVTPKDIEQQIKTKNKFLNKDLIVKDLIVKKIPFFETSNEEGGNTVYIGKEL